MVLRKINGVEIEIDERKSNELYFEESFVESIDDFDGDILTIKEAIYNNGKNKYIPLSILWELTNCCNFSCPFCYINTKSAVKTPIENINNYKNMVDELLEKGMLFCTISGGECMLHPNFKDIYMYLKEKGVVVSIFTNGSLIDDEILQMLNEYKPYKVEISIYGIKKDNFKRATNSNHNCETVLNNVLKLKDMGIDVRCKTPITKLTNEDIPLIRSWCNDNEIEYYVSNELFDSYYGESVDVYKDYGDIYIKTVEKKEENMKIKSSRSYGRKKAWECSAGRYSGVIAADGFFYPCMSSVGIKEYQFEVRHGVKNAIEKYIELLKIEKGRNLNFCDGCYNCNVCEKCVLSVIKDSKEELINNCKYIKEL